MYVRDGVMAHFLPAATVCGIPTVFVGWGVGLLCRRSGLLGLFAFSIYAVVLGLKSSLLITFNNCKPLCASWIALIVASDVCFTTLVIIEFGPDL